MQAYKTASSDNLTLSYYFTFPWGVSLIEKNWGVVVSYSAFYLFDITITAHLGMDKLLSLFYRGLIVLLDGYFAIFNKLILLS